MTRIALRNKKLSTIEDEGAARGPGCVPAALTLESVRVGGGGLRSHVEKQLEGVCAVGLGPAAALSPPVSGRRRQRGRGGGCAPLRARVALLAAFALSPRSQRRQRRPHHPTAASRRLPLAVHSSCSTRRFSQFTYHFRR